MSQENAEKQHEIGYKNTRSNKTKTKSTQIEEIMHKENPTNKDLLIAMAAFQEKVYVELDTFKAAFSFENNKTKKEVHEVSKEVCNLKSELNMVKQKLLELEVIVTGLPKTNQEAGDTTNRICNKLNFNTDFIQSTYKFPVKENNNRDTIVIKFSNATNKSSFMRSLKENGPIKIEELFSGTTDHKRININDRLTSDNMKIIGALFVSFSDK